MQAEIGLLDYRLKAKIRPACKALLALLLWSNSSITMTLCCMWLETQLSGAVSLLSYIAGVGLTVALSIAQIATKDVSPGGYLVALLPDVATTAIQWTRLLRPVGDVLLGPVAGLLLAIAAASVVGWHSSRLPERMLFGRPSTGRTQP